MATKTGSIRECLAGIGLAVIRRGSEGWLAKRCISTWPTLQPHRDLQLRLVKRAEAWLDEA